MVRTHTDTGAIAAGSSHVLRDPTNAVRIVLDRRPLVVLAITSRMAIGELDSASCLSSQDSLAVEARPVGLRPR